MRPLFAALSTLVAFVAAAAAAPRPSVSWALDRIDQAALPLDGRFDPGASGTGVTIYIVDTGVAVAHEDFGGRASYLGDFRSAPLDGPADAPASDEAGPCASDGVQGHGTHTASLAAGSTFGVAREARIAAAKTNCDNDLAAQVAAAGRAFRYIAAHGRRPGVINLSFRYKSAALNQAIHQAIAAGFVVTLSAGCAGDVTQYWGSDEAGGVDLTREALIVAGTDERDRPDRSGGSYGPKLTLFAPGIRVTSAAAFGTDGQPSTSASYTSSVACSDSYAAPLAAGAAALVLERSPRAMPIEVRAALLDRATKGAVVDAGTSNNMLLRVP
jgi:subtilisin family serine protease